MKKNRKIYIQFICGLVLCGLLGGVCGLVIGGNHVKLNEIAAMITRTVQKNAGVCQVIIGIVMLILILVFYVVGHMKFKRLEENEELFDSFDSFCNLVTAVSSVHIIIQFVFYGIWLHSINDDMNYFILFWFIGMGMFTLVVQLYVISKIKKYNPTKKAHPLEQGFCRKWMESCDEAEKYMVYAASYHTYTNMGKALKFTAAILAFCNMVTNIGILPFVVVGVLWLIQVVSYYHWINQLSRNKINY